MVMISARYIFLFSKFLSCPQSQKPVARNINLVDSNISVIRFPVPLRKKLIYKEKGKLKKKSDGSLQLARPGKIMISANKKSDSMYTDEFCSKFNPPVLTSSTWTSRRSPGRYFTIHPTKENPSLNSKASFDELHLSKEIIEALRINNVTDPTVIQTKAIPTILDGNNVMLAAETGCGKTLAYLLPVLQRVLALKENEFSSVPRVLILVPTQELVKQIVAMGSNLNLPIKYLSLSSSHAAKIAKLEHYSTSDVIVGTPSLVMNAIVNRKLNFNDLEFAVLDECDTLLDDSFRHTVTTILKHFNIKKGLSKPVLNQQSVQLLLSSATFPKHAQTALEDIVLDENILPVRTGYLHRVSPHVKHRFFRVRPSQKLERAVGLVERDVPAIMFCNFRKSALELHRALQQQAVPSFLFDSALPAQLRSKRMHEFIEGECNLMVATDLLSRGLDTKRIKHVINYEVPNNVSDYIHRCGRVGRVGQTSGCSVTTLVSRRWEVDTIKKIEEAARRREEIATVNANIKQIHESRWNVDYDL